MEEFKNLEEERRTASGITGGRCHSAVPKGVASDEMCVFLILNISSLQLIPMNVVAYRSQYGSVNWALRFLRFCFVFLRLSVCQTSSAKDTKAF